MLPHGPVPQNQCRHCRKFCNSITALTHHLAKSPRCKLLHETELNQSLKRKRSTGDTTPLNHIPEPRRQRRGPDSTIGHDQNTIPSAIPLQEPLHEDHNLLMEPDISLDRDDEDCDAQLPTRPSQCSTRDVPDEPVLPGRRWHQEFPSSFKAGLRGAQSRTTFDCIRDDQVLREGEIWGPFEDERQWEVVKWLIRNVGHTSAESFLKLTAVRTSNSASDSLDGRSLPFSCVVDSGCPAGIEEH